MFVSRFDRGGGWQVTGRGPNIGDRHIVKELSNKFSENMDSTWMSMQKVCVYFQDSTWSTDHLESKRVDFRELNNAVYSSITELQDLNQCYNNFRKMLRCRVMVITIGTDKRQNLASIPLCVIKSSPYSTYVAWFLILLYCTAIGRGFKMSSRAAVIESPFSIPFIYPSFKFDGQIVTSCHINQRCSIISYWRILIV